MRIVLVTIVLLCSFMNNLSSANQSRPVSTASNNVDSAMVITLGQIKKSKIQQQVFSFLEPIYAKLGITLKVISYPSKRSLSFSNQGQLDGELLRSEGIEDSYQNLIPIPINLYQVNAYAYTINGSKAFKKASDVLHFPVAIHRGVQWEERFSSQFPRYISRVASTKQKFKLLTLGRVDYVLSSEQRANKIINKYFSHDNIVRVSPLIKKINLIHYLNKKHIKLVPRLLAEISKQQHQLPLAHLN